MRVDVRAVGALSCLGDDPRLHAAALRAGRGGLAPVGTSSHLRDAELIAAVIPNQDSSERRPQSLTECLVDRLLDSGGLTDAERRGCAVFVGTTTGFAASEEIAWYREKARGGTWKLLCGGPGQLAAFVARRVGSRAPVFTYTTACTSTAVGLLMAAQMIRAGQIERALVFGLDVLMKISIEGFRYLQLYSEKRCRPFDRDRDGLQLGEAAAGVLLEPRRGEGRRFELLEGAIRHDPSHIAAGSTDGATAAAVIGEALRRSGIAPAEVAAVKAHGTGTPTNDLSELRGMQTAFAGRPPPFSSLKGAFGHTLGASSALETAAWLWCLEEGFVPASAGFETPMDEVPLSPLARPLPTEGRPGAHLFNSFGFGGTSVSYVIRDHGAA